MIVWIDMLPGDSLAAAEKAVRQFDPDLSVTHFYDPRQHAGRSIAESLKAEAGKVAWDIYLFYSADNEWGEKPPPPLDWAHQLSGQDWADPTRLYTGENLAPKLGKIIDKIFGR